MFQKALSDSSPHTYISTVVHCDCPSLVSYIYTRGNDPKIFEVKPALRLEDYNFELILLGYHQHREVICLEFIDSLKIYTAHQIILTAKFRFFFCFG